MARTGGPIQHIGRLFFVIACTMATAHGCVAEPVDTSLDDCYAICAQYRSCFDSHYDTLDCNDRCRADQFESHFARDTDQCSACFLERSCASANDNCGAVCDWVVP